jgi:chemotaxis protein methyltransferase CheR
MNLSEQEFQATRLLVQNLCGIWLGDDKKYLVRTRLESLLERNKLSAYSELVQRASVASNVRLHDEIIEAITTNETSFNRDGHPFEAIRQTILPRLIANRLARQRSTGLPFGKLRIWSAAASTGQEAYSLAMAILDHIHTQSRNAATELCVRPENFSILGTDISPQALRVATLGVYQERELERGLTKEQQKKYFIGAHGKFSAHPQVMKMVDFRRLDLVKPFTDMNGFELVLCRNALIYFDEPTRRRVVDQLVKSLAPGGILMLGAVESLPYLPTGIAQEQIGKTIVFRKI